ncbi:MAG: hypothetical protein FJ109_02390 [Deltaproteobacteria bacterium]|nr:hypothetical protein [Deltaproteobacteria bacterium]
MKRLLFVGSVCLLASCAGTSAPTSSDADGFSGLMLTDERTPPPPEDAAVDSFILVDVHEAPDAEVSGAPDVVQDVPPVPEVVEGKAVPPDLLPPPVDTDGDGLSDAEEKQLGTDPKSKDSDKDGLDDWTEVQNGSNPLKQDSDYDGLTDKQELEWGTDANNPDCDDDGLKDGKEIQLGTHPLTADTDGDGLKDGDEVNAGSSPLKADTDGDGLSDLEEVTLYKTDPSQADTDGDGISDPEELTIGTDPGKLDTDGDGLTDPKELQDGTDPKKADTDGDGIDDKTEYQVKTDPKNPDSDGDGLSDGYEVAHNLPPLNPDTDGDGLKDGAELVTWGTDPLDSDTDKDGLTDGNEVELGTDPLALDSDGDGADDGAEVTLGFDPANPDTDGDGVPDGQEPLFTTCGQFNLIYPQYLDSGLAGFTLAIQPAAKVVKLSLADPLSAAAVMDQDAGGLEVAAFMLSYIPEDGQTDVDALSSMITAKLNPVCGTGKVRSSGYKVKSWDDQFDLKVMVVLDVTCSGGGWNVATVRNQALSVLSNTAPADLADLPAPFGNETSEFVVSYLVESREMGRLIIVGAAAPRSRFDDLADPTRLEVNDFVNGSNLANYLNGTSDDCTPFEGKTAKADFIWAVDNSGSMDNDKATVAANVPKFTQLLSNAGVDYRLAVTYQNCSDIDGAGANGLSAELVNIVLTNDITNAKSNCTSTTSGTLVNGNLCNGKFTTSLTEFQNCVLANVSGSGSEYTLSTGMMAIDRSLPRKDNTSNKLRTDASTILVVLTDEHEQAFENELSWMKNDTPTDPAQIAQLKKITDPYIAWLKKPEVNAIVFGLIVMPNMGVGEAAVGIYRVVNETGGTAGHLPAGDLSATLQEVIGAAIGYSSVVKFEHVPISMTIQISIAQAGKPAKKIPRSRIDGFEYDSLSNGLVFHGSYVPKSGDELAVSYIYWLK